MNDKIMRPQERDALSAGPIRVVLTRDIEESVHLVDASIRTIEDVVANYGDVTRKVIPRSAIKPIQVIPLILTGAADAYDVTPEEIALGTASHSGEPVHLAAVSAWLRRIGLDETHLECGASRPFSAAEADRRIAAGETFEPIHNCCSGKHAGFLTIAKHLGIDPSGYIEPEHPVQRLVLESIETFSGVSLAGAATGIDGCGIPTHPLPLAALARSMAVLSNPTQLEDKFRSAASTAVDALAANPFWMSGTDRPELRMASAASERVVTKTGAEGVFMAALPDRGIGLALKTRDGATRAADLAIAAVLESLEVIPPGQAVAPLTNAAGTVVGTMQAHLS